MKTKLECGEPKLIDSERPMASAGNRPNAECGSGSSRPPPALSPRRGWCARRLGGAAHGHLRRGKARNDGKRTKSDQVNRIKSDQTRPNQTKSDQKNGPARIKAQAVRSRLGQANHDFGRARWMRGNSERMHGQAKDLSDCNTFYIYDTGERESGLAENLRLCSLMFAYVRLCSLMFA